MHCKLLQWDHRGTRQVFKVGWVVGDQRQTENLRAEAHWDRGHACLHPAWLQEPVALETKGACWKAESARSVLLGDRGKVTAGCQAPTL